VVKIEYSFIYSAKLSAFATTITWPMFTLKTVLVLLRFILKIIFYFHV